MKPLNNKTQGPGKYIEQTPTKSKLFAISPLPEFNLTFGLDINESFNLGRNISST